MQFYLEHHMLVDFSLLMVIIVTMLMTFIGSRVNNAETNAPRVLLVIISGLISGVIVSSFDNVMFFHWLFRILEN